MPRLLVALLAVAALLAAASAFAQGLSREEALQALKRPDTAARRLAAQSLGAAGRMADVPALLGLLRDRDDEARTLAEQSIWAIWGRSGDARVDQLYEEGVKQMQSGLAVEAIATFSRIVELKPEFAEGWNKRATVYYMAGDYKKSLADCHEVLKRNANHFGALSGYGLELSHRRHGPQDHVFRQHAVQTRGLFQRRRVPYQDRHVGARPNLHCQLFRLHDRARLEAPV